jgi:hypothetical protein
MTGECSDLGGHGVVGASRQVTETPGDSFTAVLSASTPNPETVFFNKTRAR